MMELSNEERDVYADAVNEMCECFGYLAKATSEYIPVPDEVIALGLMKFGKAFIGNLLCQTADDVDAVDEDWLDSVIEEAGIKFNASYHGIPEDEVRKVADDNDLLGEPKGEQQSSTSSPDSMAYEEMDSGDINDLIDEDINLN